MKKELTSLIGVCLELPAKNPLRAHLGHYTKRFEEGLEEHLGLIKAYPYLIFMLLNFFRFLDVFDVRIYAALLNVFRLKSMKTMANCQDFKQELEEEAS